MYLSLKKHWYELFNYSLNVNLKNIVKSNLTIKLKNKKITKV